MLNFFNSIEHLEPKCPSCKTIIEYGLTTAYDSKKKGHVCKECKCFIS